ncbi:hypothetical protein JYT74_00685 [Crocinitomix catalasitica]|nr:hypothetical protein [Crocinitomix catalasitica]
MSKSGKIAIIGGVIALFIILLYFFGGKEKEDIYVTDNWYESYDPDDKGPYGTYVMKELLDTVRLFGNFLEINTDLDEALQDNPDVNDIYFFIGAQNYLDDSACQYLLDFINAGNTAFFSCRFYTEHWLNNFVFDSDVFYEEGVFDSVQYFKFLHPDLKSKRYENTYIFNNKVSSKYWHYFNQENFDIGWGDTIVPLGTNTVEQWNYVRIEYGGGLIFLHSTPHMFTNISLMKREGFQYAEQVLKHIPPGRVQWDRYYLYDQRWRNSLGDGGGGEERRSILEFIMAHPPLIFAALILLIGAMLYALFKGKRMQKIIPPGELKENTSMRYVNTLASLYMQEKKHNKLIKLKEKTFLNFFADHYYIITKEADEKFIKKVALKSQVPEEEIKEIFDLFRKLELIGEVTDEQLIILHRKIENFYKKCR